MKQYENSATVNLSKKWQHEGKEADIEEALYLWFNEKRLQGALLPGGTGGHGENRRGGKLLSLLRPRNIKLAPAPRESKVKHST